jgi:hypothetical protein
VAQGIGIVTRRDDDFLERTEPFAEPGGGGLEHGSAGYAEGLRQSRAEHGASQHNERRAAMSKAFVVGAVVMGAAVVVAAAFTVLVFAGLFTVSSGVGGGHSTVTLVQEPPSTTTPASSPSDASPSDASPSDATDPPSQSDTTAPVSPSTAAQAGRSPLPPSHRVANPRTTAGAQDPAGPPSNSSGSEQPSSTSSPPPSDAPAPAPLTAPAACSKGRKQGRPSMCSKR